MFKISVTRRINKPINEVFSLLSDHANYSRFKGIDESRLIQQGHEDKNGLGAIREIISAAGTLHEEIVRFETPAQSDNKTAVIGYKIIFSEPLPYEHFLGEVHLSQTGGQISSQVNSVTDVKWISQGRINTFLLGPFFYDKQIQKHGSRAFGSILKYIDTL